MTLAERFPHASANFLALNQALAAGVSHPQPKRVARPQPLDTHQAKEGGKGRTLVRITRRGSRLLDFDNGAGGCKAIIDALRYEGLISDDNPGSIDFVFTQEKVKRSEVGTVIEIEPA